MSNAAIMEKGMDALLKSLGVLDTEEFISTLLRERFNYTEWHQAHFAAANPRRLLQDAVAFDQNNPLT